MFRANSRNAVNELNLQRIIKHFDKRKLLTVGSLNIIFECEFFKILKK